MEAEGGSKVTAKEYLQEIRKFDRYIEQKQIEYDSLYRLRGGAGGIDYSKDKVQTSQMVRDLPGFQTGWLIYRVRLMRPLTDFAR